MSQNNLSRQEVIDILLEYRSELASVLPLFNKKEQDQMIRGISFIDFLLNQIHSGSEAFEELTKEKIIEMILNELEDE